MHAVRVAADVVVEGGEHAAHARVGVLLALRADKGVDGAVGALEQSRQDGLADEDGIAGEEGRGHAQQAGTARACLVWTYGEDRVAPDSTIGTGYPTRNGTTATPGHHPAHSTGRPW